MFKIERGIQKVVVEQQPRSGHDSRPGRVIEASNFKSLSGAGCRPGKAWPLGKFRQRVLVSYYGRSDVCFGGCAGRVVNYSSLLAV